VKETYGMSIEEQLIKQYGPLLNTAQLAVVLHRSVESLRISLRSSSEWARAINTAKLQLGRRTYFRTGDVARVLSGG
jgi:hypothetical protein